MSKKTFLIAVTLSWVCPVLAIVLMFITRAQLPDVLRSYLAARQPSLSLAASIVWLTLALAYSCASIAATVGIYFWQSWARLIYTIVVPTGWLLLLPLGNRPFVTTNWVNIATGLAATFTGITLCGMWFVSGIHERFQKRIQHSS